MACAGCIVNTKEGTPLGCRNKGSCRTGGCNKLNTFDWLAIREIEDIEEFSVVEVSFKNGARKGFYQKLPHMRLNTGDMVAVEAQVGYDIGRITLSGELVRLQMRKRKVPENAVLPKVLRRANKRDLEKLAHARELEPHTMVRARAIARTLGLEMKIGDVEYQGDCRKATFYYTADGRVDFRELIRHYAKEFRVKIEMRQIGARQESARIGGIGSCGRELCCSTWLTNFQSVSTAAARYQNLAINQAKLSGMCGRLKCCLNYELDTYMEALEAFPAKAEKLKTESGTAVLVKTDIFQGLMYYAYEKEGTRGKLYPLTLERVREIKALNDEGRYPPDLIDLRALAEQESEEESLDFAEDLTGVIELPPEEKKKRRRKKRRNRNRSGAKNSGDKNQREEPNQTKNSGNDSRRRRSNRGRNAGKNRNRPPKS